MCFCRLFYSPALKFEINKQNPLDPNIHMGDLQNTRIKLRSQAQRNVIKALLYKMMLKDVEWMALLLRSWRKRQAEEHLFAVEALLDRMTNLTYATFLNQCQSALRRMWKGDTSVKIHTWRQKARAMQHSALHEAQTAVSRLKESLREMEEAHSTTLQNLNQAHSQAAAQWEASAKSLSLSCTLSLSQAQKHAGARQVCLVVANIMRGKKGAALQSMRMAMSDELHRGESSAMELMQAQLSRRVAEGLDTMRLAAMRELGAVFARMMQGEIGMRVERWRSGMRWEMMQRVQTTQAAVEAELIAGRKNSALRLVQLVLTQMLRGKQWVVLHLIRVAMADERRQSDLAAMRTKSDSQLKSHAVREMRATLVRLTKGSVAMRVEVWRSKSRWAMMKRVNELRIAILNSEETTHVTSKRVDGLMKQVSAHRNVRLKAGVRQVKHTLRHRLSPALHRDMLWIT